jgi:uncharacterized protein
MYDRREPAHAVTRQAFEHLQRQRVALYVTDYVLDETLTLIQARVGHATAVSCGSQMLRARAIHLVHIDSEIWTEAWQMFQKYDDQDDQDFSFTDCTSFVVMRRLKIVDAFTADHHFEQMGFRLWPH